jgi:hypothetical protein
MRKHDSGRLRIVGGGVVEFAVSETPGTSAKLVLEEYIPPETRVESITKDTDDPDLETVQSIMYASYSPTC